MLRVSNLIFIFPIYERRISAVRDYHGITGVGIGLGHACAGIYTGKCALGTSSISSCAASELRISSSYLNAKAGIIRR